MTDKKLKILWVDAECQKAIKVVAAQRGITIQEATKEAVQIYINKMEGNKNVTSICKGSV